MRGFCTLNTSHACIGGRWVAFISIETDEESSLRIRQTSIHLWESGPKKCPLGKPYLKQQRIFLKKKIQKWWSPVPRHMCICCEFCNKNARLCEICRHRRNLLTFSEAAFLHWWIIFYFVLETSVIFVIYRLQVIIKFQSSPINDNNQSRNTNDQQSLINHQTVKNHTFEKIHK